MTFGDSALFALLQIQRFGPHVPINAAFPFDSVAMTLFGLSDADRNARMDALDKWLREVK